MVSLWPFKAEDSAATYEKTLSSLATKIGRTSAKNDALRQASRRAKAMWTLYTTFAYIFALLILLLVIGWENWQWDEYGAVFGSPLLIFGVRYVLNAYYTYRISSTEAHLTTLTKERDETIEKLKAATKYNSIKQLVEKYGDDPLQRTPPSNKSSPNASTTRRKSAMGKDNSNVRRTGFMPPPTANIPVNRPPKQQPAFLPEQQQQMLAANGLSVGPSPLQQRQQQQQLQSSTYPPQPSSSSPALNLHSRYTSSSATATDTFPTSHWYDRILDVLLGDDETQPKNRFALICASCRMVNGQAPPGTRQLSDVGRWRCASCMAWNGVESETKELVDRIQRGVEMEEKKKKVDGRDDGSDMVDHDDDNDMDGRDADADADADKHVPRTPEAKVKDEQGDSDERLRPELLELLKSKNTENDTASSMDLDRAEMPPAISTRSMRRKNKK